MTSYFIGDYAFNIQMMLCLTAFIFGERMKPRNKFYLRLPISLAVGLTINILLAYFLSPHLMEFTFAPSLLFLFYAIVLLTVVGLSFQLHRGEIIFLGTAAYALQHLLNSIENLLSLYLDPVLPYWLSLLIHGYLLFILGALVMIFIIRKINKNGYIDEFADPFQSVLVLLILSVCILMSIYTGHLSADYPDEYRVVIIPRIYSGVCAALILILQFGIFSRNKLKYDNEVITQMIQKDAQEKQIRQETVNLLNMKYHDLRHFVYRIEKADQKKEYVDEINKALEDYSSFVKTGNKALDIILTEKNLFCTKYNIKNSYIIDTSHLGFISEPDIYSLFGNALENAIESLSKEEDVDKRVLSLRVSGDERYLFIRLENYCSAKIEFDSNMMPKTQKEDTQVHGFGMKSIKYIVDKYNGVMKIENKDNMFILNIMFPLLSATSEQ